MSQADLEINRAVRRIFVRHWLDLGRLSIRSSLGRLSIRGAIDRIDGVKEQLNGAIIDSMFAEIRRIPAVRGVYSEISNWTCQSGRWQPIGQTPSAGSKEKRASDASSGTATTFDADRAIR